MRRFWREESGATVVEYALVASIVAICIIAGLIVTRTNLITMFQSVSTGLTR